MAVPFIILSGGIKVVKINGKDLDAAGRSIAEIVTDEGYDCVRVAVELNEKIISKTEYESTVLRDGDRVEIISFVGGG